MKSNFTTLLRAYLLAISLLTANKAFSQLTDWKNYTSNNWVHCLLNDGDYLWIATDGGLVKMNKITQEKIYYNRANAALPDNNILNMAKDKEGNIWIGSLYSGIGCLNDKQCKIFNTYNSGIKRDDYAGSAIAIDEYNNKWIGTLFFLNKFDGKNWQAWTTPGSDLISSIWVIHSMKFDKEGILWMGGNGGNWSFAKFDGTEIQILYDIGRVNEIEIDNSDNKWLAANIGLIKYDGENFTIYNEDNSLLPYSSVTDVKLDKKGNLWIIGSNYLTKYDGTNFIHYQVSLPDPTNWLTCLEIDDENIWIGTRRDGVYLFKDGEFKHINCNNNPLLSNDISFYGDVDKENNVWIGTAQNLIKVDEQDKWNVLYQKMEYGIQRRILGVNCAPNGDMWVSLGLSDTCVLRISKEDTVAFTKQNTPLFDMLSPEYDNGNFAFDRKGNTWMASRTGLFKYDGNTWSVLTPENSPLPDYMITPLVVDKDDNLWVGSGSPYGGGLCKYDGKNWTIYNTKNSGLPTPMVITMAFDSKNILWLSCRDTTNMGVVGRIFGGGLTRFDGKSWKSYNIDNSGIPSNTIMDIVIDKNDDLWLATYGRGVGITKYDGKNWEVYNMGNSGIAWDKVSKITLDYKRDLIWLNHLDFGGISTAKLNFDGNGIETLPTVSDKSLLAYPNPTKDKISFYLKEGEKPCKVEVYALSGELICSKPLFSDTARLPDLNIHQKGLYLLKVFTSAEKYYSGRIIVIK